MVFCPGDAPEMLGFADTEQKSKENTHFWNVLYHASSVLPFKLLPRN